MTWVKIMLITYDMYIVVYFTFGETTLTDKIGGVSHAAAASSEISLVECHDLW